MGILAALLPTLLTSLPSIIKGVETLFVTKPKSGAQKMAAVQSLIQNAAPIAEAVDASQAQAIADLTTATVNALVAYYNAIGEFKTTGK